jgi:hypothetical protein
VRERDTERERKKKKCKEIERKNVINRKTNRKKERNVNI